MPLTVVVVLIIWPVELAAFILSLIGVSRDSRKGWAITGLVLSAIICTVIAVPVIMCIMHWNPHN